MAVVWTRPYRFHIALKCKTNYHTLHFICHLDNKGGALSTKNCTEESCRKDVTGNSRCVVYVLNDPHQSCYTRFFVRGQPPFGLRTGDALQGIRYICQPPSICGQPDANDNFYATMFDEEWGIAVFSAYSLTRFMSQFALYKHQPIAKQDGYPTPGNSLYIHKMEPVPPDSQMLSTTLMFALSHQSRFVTALTIQLNKLNHYGDRRAVFGSVRSFILA